MGELERISDHVYRLPPGPPDRPALCAVVGDRRTLMLDAGSSRAHTGAFLDALWDACSVRPDAVVLTHSHWDHVLGAVELGGLVIAHASTAAGLAELAERDWSDEGLDLRVAAGLDSPQHAEHVKQELPSPRTVEVAQAEIVFADGLDLELGGVTVHVRHVGGDHAADSCVMVVEPDRVLFLGDCLCGSPQGGFTPALTLPLCATLLDFDAELYVEGHEPAVATRVVFESLIGKIRLAERLARAGEPATGLDEDTQYFARGFGAGLGERADGRDDAPQR